MPLLPENYDQCAPCAVPPCPPWSIPGAKGDPGNTGTSGANGINAFTRVAGVGFVVPAISASIGVVVLETGWMALGQIVFVGSAGYYQIASISDETDVVLTNLGYAGNAVAGVTIAVAQPIVPAGIAGANGAMGGGVTSVALSVPAEFAVSGSPVTSSGTIAVTSAPAQSINKVYATPASGGAGPASMRSLVAADMPAGVPTGTVPIASGGTGQTSAAAAFNALSPTTTKGDLIVDNGSGNGRLPVGGNGQQLVADSTQTLGLKYVTPTTPLISPHRVAISNPDVMLATDYIIGINVAAPVSETLIAAPTDGREIIIKDESGAAASSKNITISAGAGDTLQGGSTLVISNNFGFFRLYYNATSKIWFVTGSA